MTAATFRRLALGLTDAVEASHMGHPDFRVDGRIFASLQDKDRGMVKLTPEQQARFLADHPAVFAPESGAWGRQGYTRVDMRNADTECVGEAMTLAWRNVRARTRKSESRIATPAADATATRRARSQKPAAERKR